MLKNELDNLSIWVSYYLSLFEFRVGVTDQEEIRPRLGPGRTLSCTLT